MSSNDLLSPLELLHPDGVALRALTVGEGCPPSLRTRHPPPQSDALDLVVIAPTAKEASSAGWLEETIASFAGRLDVDGLLYLLVSPRHRRRAIASLRRRGLNEQTTMVHVPSWGRTRYLFPLEPASALYAVSRTLDTSTWKRRVARAGLRLPGGPGLIGLLASPIGLVARREGSRALFEWLSEEDVSGQRTTAVIRTSWRGSTGPVILHIVDNSGRPVAIAKTGLTPNYGAEAEAAALCKAGSSARTAGAEVPQLLRTVSHGPRTALVESVLEGESMAIRLRSRPEETSHQVTHVTDWLTRWQGETAVTQRLEQTTLRSLVLEPAEELSPLIVESGNYFDRLEKMCATCAGTNVAMVTTHNDLTMWNVLLTNAGRLGILDWEQAREHDLPLVDFFYALTDGVAAASGYVNRFEAFVSCFSPAGEFAALTAGLHHRITRDYPVSDDLFELCLHACWLRHAVLQRRISGPEASRPFVEIVDWLASNRRVSVAT